MIRYNCLCLLVCLHGFIKRAAFCGNIRNCENVGIILRIVGDLKRISRKNNCRIIDLSLHICHALTYVNRPNIWIGLDSP